ncbi:hypothetical protein DIPPA_34156 [Diplonema papillatum]|nr:hypothetical protein DIPPA_34156 [Diplonema papillatum]
MPAPVRARDDPPPPGRPGAIQVGGDDDADDSDSEADSESIRREAEEILRGRARAQMLLYAQAEADDEAQAPQGPASTLRPAIQPSPHHPPTPQITPAKYPPDDDDDDDADFASIITGSPASAHKPAAVHVDETRHQQLPPPDTRVSAPSSDGSAAPPNARPKPRTHPSKPNRRNPTEADLRQLEEGWSVGDAPKKPHKHPPTHAALATTVGAPTEYYEVVSQVPGHFGPGGGRSARHPPPPPPPAVFRASIAPVASYPSLARDAGSWGGGSQRYPNTVRSSSARNAHPAPPLPGNRSSSAPTAANRNGHPSGAIARKAAEQARSLMHPVSAAPRRRKPDLRTPGRRLHDGEAQAKRAEASRRQHSAEFRRQLHLAERDAAAQWSAANPGGASRGPAAHPPWLDPAATDGTPWAAAAPPPEKQRGPPPAKTPFVGAERRDVSPKRRGPPAGGDAAGLRSPPSHSWQGRRGSNSPLGLSGAAGKAPRTALANLSANASVTPPGGRRRSEPGTTSGLPSPIHPNRLCAAHAAAAGDLAAGRRQSSKTPRALGGLSPDAETPLRARVARLEQALHEERHRADEAEFEARRLEAYAQAGQRELKKRIRKLEGDGSGGVGVEGTPSPEAQRSALGSDGSLVAELRGRVEALPEERERASWQDAALHGLQRDAARLQGEVEAARGLAEHNDSLRGLLRQQNDLIAELHDELAAAGAQPPETDEIAALAAGKIEAETRAGSLEAAAAALRGEKAAWEAERKRLQDGLDRARADAAASAGKLTGAAEHEAAAWKEKLASAESERDGALRGKAAADEESRRLRATLAATEAERDAALRDAAREKSAAGDEARRLRETLARAEAERDEALRSVASTRAREDTAADLNRLRDQLLASEAALRGADDQKSAAREEARRLRESLAAAEAERDGQRALADEDARCLRAKLAASEAERNSAHGVAESLKNRATGAEADSEYWRQHCKDAEERAEELQRRVNAMEVDASNPELSSPLALKSRRQDEDRSKLEELVQRLTKANADQAAELTRLRYNQPSEDTALQTSRLADLVQRLTKDNADQAAELSRLRSHHPSPDASLQMKRLEDLVQRLTQANSDQAAELTRLRSHRPSADASLQLKRLRHEADDLQQLLSQNLLPSKGDEAHRLQADLVTATRERAVAHADLAHERQRTRDAERLLDSKTSAIARLESEVADLRRHLSSATARAPPSPRGPPSSPPCPPLVAELAWTETRRGSPGADDPWRRLLARNGAEPAPPRSPAGPRGPTGDRRSEHLGGVVGFGSPGELLNQSPAGPRGPTGDRRSEHLGGVVGFGSPGELLNQSPAGPRGPTGDRRYEHPGGGVVGFGSPGDDPWQRLLDQKGAENERLSAEVAALRALNDAKEQELLRKKEVSPRRNLSSSYPGDSTASITRERAAIESEIRAAVQRPSSSLASALFSPGFAIPKADLPSPYDAMPSTWPGPDPGLHHRFAQPPCDTSHHFSRVPSALLRNVPALSPLGNPSSPSDCPVPPSSPFAVNRAEAHQTPVPTRNTTSDLASLLSGSPFSRGRAGSCSQAGGLPLRLVFMRADSDGDGQVTAEQAFTALAEAGWPEPNDDDANRAIAAADEAGRGAFDYYRFERLVRLMYRGHPLAGAPLNELPRRQLSPARPEQLFYDSY